MNNIATEVGSKGRRITVFGIITMMLGLVAISAPTATGLSIVMLVGVLVIAAGILRMIWAFGAGSLGRDALAFAIGGLTLLCGLTLVTDPLVASGFLTVVIALYLLADGVVEIIRAFPLRADSSRVWLLIGGIASILLGAMMWRQFPLSGSWAIGVLLGIKLLFVGIIMLTGGAAMRALAKSANTLA